MKLYIPAVGDRLILTAPWAFRLYLERRNIKFAKERGLVGEEFGDDYWDSYEDGRYGSRLKHARCELAAETVLECDRVYIRTFSKSALEVGNDFDSISWKVMKGSKPAKNQRFWAKLPDCYDIEYRQEIDSLYRDRVKAVRVVMES